MSRAVLVLRSEDERKRAIAWCQKAPFGTRITFQDGKRTLEQNALLWSCLTEVARQKEHFGRKYSADIWKLLFMQELGRENKFVPALDGSTVVPIGYSSSELSRDEMRELIDCILAWGAQNGVRFNFTEAA